MIAYVARTAYGNARTRALRRGLLGPSVADRIRESPTPARRAGALRSHGVEASNAAEAWSALLARLVAAAATLSRAYPVGGELLRDLARLHELENLKLALRALARRAPLDRCTALWRPLGPLAQLSREACLGVASAQELADTLQRTSYADLRPLLSRPESELLIDRWGSLRIVAQARALPARERDAGELALMLVRERDLEALSRAPEFALSP
ncbi:MAG TPA: V-type ATPase subunit, partial [Myxococcales bacterium]|nr:V-type ATPase subunit [Myxococcales bacterium]